jgi:hypothetical protein
MSEETVKSILHHPAHNDSLGDSAMHLFQQMFIIPLKIGIGLILSVTVIVLCCALGLILAGIILVDLIKGAQYCGRILGLNNDNNNKNSENSENSENPENGKNDNDCAIKNAPPIQFVFKIASARIDIEREVLPRTSPPPPLPPKSGARSKLITNV